MIKLDMKTGQKVMILRFPKCRYWRKCQNRSKWQLCRHTLFREMVENGPLLRPNVPIQNWCFFCRVRGCIRGHGFGTQLPPIWGQKWLIYPMSCEAGNRSLDRNDAKASKPSKKTAKRAKRKSKRAKRKSKKSKKSKRAKTPKNIKKQCFLMTFERVQTPPRGNAYCSGGGSNTKRFGRF